MRAQIAVVLSLWLSVGSAWSAEAPFPAPLPVDTQPADAGSATSDPPAPDRPAPPATEPPAAVPSWRAGWKPEVRPGERIRLTARGPRGRFEALFVESDDQAVSLRLLDRDEIVHVDWSLVTRFERYAGTRSCAHEGTVVGLVVPGLPLGVYGFVAGTVGNMDCGSDCHAAAPFVWGALGLALGAGIGRLVGSVFRTSRWEEVPDWDLRINVTPRRHGAAVGLTMSF